MTVTKTEYELKISKDTTLKEFLKLGEDEILPAVRLSNAVPWWMGDYVNFGETRFGEKYSQAISQTDYNYDELVRYAYICRHVPPANRPLCKNLSMGLAVARLDPEKQKKYLLEAGEHGWTTDQLSKLLKQQEPSGSTRGRKARPKKAFADWVEEYSTERDLTLSEAVVEVMQDAWKAGQENK